MNRVLGKMGRSWEKAKCTTQYNSVMYFIRSFGDDDDVFLVEKPIFVVLCSLSFAMLLQYIQWKVMVFDITNQMCLLFKLFV